MKSMFRKILMLLFFPVLLQAQPIEPDKMGEELITFLQQNYSPASTLGYGPARDILYSEIDNIGNDLFGIYTNFKVTLDPNEDPSQSAFQDGQGLNAEHVYPQSKGASDEPQRSDMHNIFPSKVNVNEARGSCEYDEIDDSDTENWYYLDMISNNIPTSGIENYSEKDSEDCKFEPRESVKGDLARAVFYFYTIYQTAADNADPIFFHNQKEILLQWHLDDPVDQKEMDRNDLISDEQGNKNPFIIDETLAQRAYFPTNSVEKISVEKWVSISSNVVQNNLQIFSEKENGNILLFDSIGQLVLEEKLKSEVNIDVGKHPSGTYILQVRSKKMVKVFRIVKR